MSFIEDYFVKPMIDPTIQGYNLVNTIVFIFLLVIACFIIYSVLKKKVEFNYNFLIALLPYIIFGISLRVIMHQIETGLLILPGIFKTANPLELGFWFFTPGIWLLTFGLVIIGLLVGEIWKKLKTKRVFYFGIIIMLAPLIFNFSKFNNWIWFLGTGILILIVSYGFCFLINKFTKYKILEDKVNFFIILGQGIDGIASAIAIWRFDFVEQHVFSNILMDIHPGLFAGIKLGIAFLICYSLDDYKKENPKQKSIISFVKVIIAILGLATGLASLFKLGIIPFLFF